MPSREQLEKLLESEPDDVLLNFGLAMELARQGHPDEAVARLDRVLELDPTYIAAYSQKSAILIARARQEEARAVLEAGMAAANRAGDTHAAGEMRKILNTLGPPGAP